MLLRGIGFLRMKIERRSRWDPKWRPIDALCQFLENIYWKAMRYQVVECLGDSHVAAFRRVNFNFPEISYRFRTCSVLGATVHGLAKQVSSTNSRNVFLKRLDNLPRDSIALICLGEVDASFLIWFLAQRKNEPIDAVLNDTLQRYQEFLLLAKQKVGRLMVCSAPLPTMMDGQKHPDGLLLRDNISVPYLKRTQMALRFNRKMADFCKDNSIEFVDFGQDVVDTGTGLLDKRFIRKDHYDNHYSETEYIKIIAARFMTMNIESTKRTI